MLMTLLSTLTRWPWPSGPTWKICFAKQEKTGLRLSTAAASPPAMTLSSAGPRLPAGPSSAERRRASCRPTRPVAASCSVSAGSLVEQSTSTSPGRPTARSPASPAKIDRTVATSGRQVITMSDAATSAPRLSISTAPRLSRSSILSRRTWGRTRTSCPCPSRFLQIPWPMRPTPTKPIRALAMVKRPPRATAHAPE